MKGAFGLPQINMHKVTVQLDKNKQVTSNSEGDTLCSVTGVRGNVIKHTITNGVATITEPGYIEGSEVAIHLWCLRADEDGGACKQIL